MSLEDRLRSRAKQKLGVDWTLPGRKRRFTSSTVATSNLIACIGECGLTFSQAARHINFDDEAADICEYFVLKGFGEDLVSKFVS